MRTSSSSGEGERGLSPQKAESYEPSAAGGGSWSPHGNSTGTRVAALTSDPLSPQRRADVEQLLHGQGIGLLVAHHGDVVETVEIGQCLPKEMAPSGGKGLGLPGALGGFTTAKAHQDTGEGWDTAPRHSIFPAQGTLSTAAAMKAAQKLRPWA